MSRRAIAVACLAAALLACGGKGTPSAAPAAAHPAGAQPSAAPTQPPEAMIRGLYAPYLADGDLPDVIADDREALQRTFDDELTELFLADFACQRRGDGVCNIDWDPFIAGQDWKLAELAVSPAATGAGKATVEVTFDNMDMPTTVRYSLVLMPRGWRIADIDYPPGGPDRPSLKATLSAPPPA